MNEFGLSEYDAAVLTSSRAIADYFCEASRTVKDKKLVANWVMGEVAAAVHDAENMDYSDCPVKAQTLAQILERLSDGTVNAKGAKKLFGLIWDGASEDVDALIEKQGLKQISDAGAIEPIIDEILAKNAQMVEQFRNGKQKAFNALVGQAMKATRGKANPQQVNEILRRKLAL